MKQPVRNPYSKRIAGAGIGIVIGSLLLFQPWNLLLKLLGGIVLANSVPLCALNLLHRKRWNRMIAKPLLTIEDAVFYEGGIQTKDEFHFLLISGCKVERCAYEENVLSLRYSFAARKERGSVELNFDIPAEKEQDALLALAMLERYKNGEPLPKR